ncbi:MAG: hypothetical protein H0T21_06375 [Gemmatimonadaceae bacterium]|nr:hypothetical protein [Gemmatimonadaceae bacterium]
MRRRLTRAFAFAILSTAAAAPPAHSQRVLGVGDDALVLPRGVLRVRVLGQFTEFNERYGLDTPGRPDGALEPLGVDLTLDTLGVLQFPNLASLQAGLRSLSGIPNFGLTLGNTVVGISNRVTAIPIVIEAGLTSKLSVGVTIPYVRTRSNVTFLANTGGFQGNVGFNPALGNPTAIAQNMAFAAQFSSAAAQLNASLTACLGSTAPQCAALNAQRGNAQALIASASQFAAGVGQIYSTSPFVPIAGTDAQLAIDARVAAFKALYASFGVTSITTTGPFASQTRLTARDAQQILTQPAFGVLSDPLQTVDRGHIGDIDIGGEFALFDTFGGSTEARMSPKGLNYRAAVGAVVRLPTGQGDSPNNFTDLGTGQGQTDLEGRFFGDVLIGSRFWQSFVVRYINQLADNEFIRITDLPGRTLAPQYRRQKVERDLGNVFEFETTPRVVINQFFAVSGMYFFRRKSEDSYKGMYTIPAGETGFTDITLNAATLNLETEAREHRIGGGISFSNLYAFEQGKAKIPFEVTYLHWQTTGGSGGNQPKFFTDQIQLRLYSRLFGGK